MCCCTIHNTLLLLLLLLLWGLRRSSRPHCYCLWVQVRCQRVDPCCRGSMRGRSCGGGLAGSMLLLLLQLLM
jgi:hypothetical protein